MPEVISSATYKARKVHSCDYCEGDILPGEKYTRDVLIIDDIYHWKSHERCGVIANQLIRSGFLVADDGITEEMYQEAVRELYDTFVENPLPKPSMEEITKKLEILFLTHDLKEHKPKGYVEGYLLEERREQNP